MGIFNVPISGGVNMNDDDFIDKITFGVRVKNARNSIGMTIQKLAEKSDKSVNFISRIESGQKGCSINTLRQLCMAMNISADDLLFGDKVKLEDYSDMDIIQNILNKCNAKQLAVLKDVLVAIFTSFDDLQQ